MSDAYKAAGVDIDAGEELVERIKPMAKSTHRKGVLGGLGGFGGLFSLAGQYRDPILVSGTDGVGTKLLVANLVGKHDTIGIDLVAMCANDVLVTGAEPLFFLDYFATGALDVSAAASVISGIAEGCRQAGAALLGGETAEMPGMYAPGHYDLAGFVVGAVERDEVLDGSDIIAGDKLVGLPSTGIHSNGYSLARKVLLNDGGLSLDADPEGVLGTTLGLELLKPTKIYAEQMLSIRGRFKGAAHITGGGLPGNIPRVLPKGCGAFLDGSAWNVPPIFGLIQRMGGISTEDMLRTFNMGLGMVLVVASSDAESVAAAVGGSIVGTVTESADQEVVVS
jgi:phosphoribosylformylglycinamidine cyclo-ligase